jgi:hypothetical protein
MFIKHLLESKKIRFYTRYTRYVDDIILIMYDKTMTDPDLPTTNMNHIYKSIIFKPTTEYNEQINNLHLLLTWKDFSTACDISHKPTTTDTTKNLF